MDPFAIFALTVGMAIAASQQAAVMEQYAARGRYAQPVVAQPAWEPAPVAYVPVAPAPAPVPGWVAGAAVGSQVGALVSASNPIVRCRGRACGMGFDPRPVVAGAVIGGLIGHAATTPPPAVALAAVEAAPVARRSPSASREFTDHWQNFMEPSVSRAAAPRVQPVPAWGR